MIERSLSSPADSVCYDLEDSVTPGKKSDARRLVADLLEVRPEISLYLDPVNVRLY
jgi:citrate lyase beta subunit